MAKRKYEKRDTEYWDKFNQKAGPEKIGDISGMPGSTTNAATKFVGASTAGDPFYTKESIARRASTSSADRTSKRRNNAHRVAKSDRFTNIDNYDLPYEEGAYGISIKDATILCRKAYSNVPIFKNTIDIMSELANSEIYLEGGSKKSKEFVKKWFKRIKIWKIKDQFFREYFRSSNNFIQRIMGSLSIEDAKQLAKKLKTDGPTGTRIPLKYIFLDTAEMAVDPFTPFSGPNYKKALSKYDIKRLRESRLPSDKADFEALPKETRDKIKQGSYNEDGVYMDLDPKDLVVVFAKKQDYEPFATPFGFPVLDDINWKIELKKIDQAISRTIENVILLVTHGNEPDKGGSDPGTQSALQEIFENESIGRVLVADYTTDDKFIVPEIEKVLGPEKYQIVNEDIKEGLQNVILGNEKFANSQIKAGIFLERLNDARQAFIQDFMQAEIDYVCGLMGFRESPVLKFEELDLKDEVQFQRIVIRMMELGVLSAEQGVEALREQVFPETESLEEAQEKYKKAREEGYYNPLMGGVQMFEGVGHDSGGDSFDNKMKKKGEIKGPSKEHGRPGGTSKIKKGEAAERFSVTAIKDTASKISELNEASHVIARKAFNKKRLNKNQKELLYKIVESVVVSQKKEDWSSSLEACINDLSKLDGMIATHEILDIAARHDLDDYSAAILYHSKEDLV